MRRAFLSGFKGSAGTAVVTTTVDNSDGNGAWLWTDSRYWNEATLQLDARHWRLQKSGLADTLSIPKWLAKTALEHRRRQEQQHNSNNNISTKDDTKIKTTSTIKPLRIGIDPYVHSASFAKEVTDALTDMAKEESLDNDKAPIGVLVTLPNNLVDAVWGDARPAIPVSPFRVHPVEYAGATVAEKIASIRKEMQSKKATAAVFCTLDDVAYVLNLRAKGDIDTCPVGIAYCMVTNTDVFLYCDSAKVVNVQDHLSESHVSVQPYDQIVSDVEQHCQASLKHKVWLDKSRSNYALANGIPLAQLVDSQNAVTPMKAVKNAAELAGMREAHIVDGVAMAKFMAWLQAEICEKGRSISEVELDHVLTGFRAEQKGFTELSFPTIAGVGSNGAIIHYRASADSDLLKYLDKSKPILIDSGGQYLYGTTDVTRTWSFQEQPDPVFCDYYTRVLKGNIGVDSMVFPENTPGLVLDVFARRWLWDIGSDYGHGTGHGVGAALNVHEGPHSISPRWANTEVLKPGMIVSNEPGYYEDGNFGIRIENLLEILFVKPEDNESSKNESDKPKSPQKKFMKFAKLTMIPIQKNLIDIRLMTDHEMDWIDGYHAEVLEKVGARLEEGSPALTWLQCACEKMNRV